MTNPEMAKKRSTNRASPHRLFCKPRSVSYGHEVFDGMVGDDSNRCDQPHQIQMEHFFALSAHYAIPDKFTI